MGIWKVVGQVGKEEYDSKYANIAVSCWEDLKGGDGVVIRPCQYQGDVNEYVEVSYTGRVVGTREMNGYHDSDFYAIVEKEPGVFTEIMYDTTRFPTMGGCKVDATEEVASRYAAYVEERRRKAAFEGLVDHHARRIEYAKTPRKGSRIIVVRGRKIPKGTEGTVFYVGVCQYSGKPRIGFTDSEENTYWTLASNCDNMYWRDELSEEEISFAIENNLIQE